MAKARGARSSARRAAGALGRGLALAAIYVYQGLSSLTPGSCRFEPTCSHYAAAAVRVHGPVRGSWLALKRILRCRPGADWGCDPVPEAGTRPQQTKHAPRMRLAVVRAVCRPGGSLRNGWRRWNSAT